MSSIRVAVLTVSDTAAANAAADKSGPTIRSILDARDGFACAYDAIVPDDLLAIRGAVSKWASADDLDWIVTTGGTGFGVRDLTPEAIKPLLEREAPGLVHILLSTSLKHTPLAALSRPIAGTIGNTLIVTLPGSVKAVKENLEALFTGGLVDHALELIRGGSGKKIHAELAAGGHSANEHSHSHSHSHSHHHHHHHGGGHDHGHNIPQPRSTLSHDPSAPGKNLSSARHRHSPYPLISYEEALRLIQQNVEVLPVETKAVTPALRGHILASDVHAIQDAPPTSTTNVDGYAIRSADQPGIYKVLTAQTHSLSTPIPAGFVYRVNTGGPVPAGADAVIMVEDTRLVSTFFESEEEGEEGEEKEIETLAQVPAGENIRAPGSDAHKGDLVLHKGELIGSVGGEIGTLAFVGRKEVEVIKKPVIAILSTGNEIVDLQEPVLLSGSGWGGVFDTNRPSLRASLEGLGYEVLDLGIVPDRIEAHVEAMSKGIQQADILLTTGGTSMGPTDLLKPIIERHFGGTIHFGRVTIKPGKPTTFATIPVEAVEGSSNAGVKTKPAFALPGNPASALVTFYTFALPTLRFMAGWEWSKCQLPRIKAELQSPTRLDPRLEFHRVILRVDHGIIKAFTTGGQRSSRVASLSGANGLIVLPLKDDAGVDVLEAGSQVEVIVIGELQMA